MKFKSVLFVIVLMLLGRVTVEAQERLIFEDDFKSNHYNWTQVDDEGAFSEVVDGFYQIEGRNPDSTSVFLMEDLPLNSNQDFSIKTKLRQKFGSKEGVFGFIWGASDYQNYYGLSINSQGQFQVSRLRNGSEEVLKAFMQTTDVVKPSGQENKVIIRNVSGMMSFYINDNFVYSMPNRTFMGNKAGYFLSGKMAVEISTLDVLELEAMPEIFTENFAVNKGTWIKTKQDSAICVHGKGRMRMRNQKGKPWTYKLQEILINPERDFEIEAHMKQVGGSQEYGYGIAWGMKARTDGYAFLIRSLGSFSVVKHQAGKVKTLKTWTQSNQTLHNRSSPNRLVIRKTGARYNFYLNDIWMAELPYQSLMGQELGFVLQGENLIEMSHLVVREGQKSYVPKPPVVTLISPQSDDVSIDVKNIQFKAGIQSDSKLNGMKLMVNNEQVNIKAHRDASEEFDLIIDQELNLVPGFNDIRLLAKNEDGLIQKFGLRVSVKSADQVVKRSGTDYALFIATSEYAEWTDLVNPVNDCRTIAEELETNYGFNTEILIDEPKTEILKKMKEYARKTYADGDQLLIFFAGHGKFDDLFGEGYVVTTDSEKNDEGNNSYIAHSNLRTIANAIPCKHTFLMMDVCFGGTIDPFIASGGGSRGGGDYGGDGGGGDLTQTEFIARKLKFKTRRYLTSGGKEYVPDGAPGHHSPFARKFLDALRNYGGHDRIVTLAELVLYFERLKPEPRFGEYGTNEPGSDFLFIAR